MNSSQTPPLTLPAFYQAQLQRVLAHQQAIEAELARRSLQDLPIEKLFRLSDLISRQLQRLLVKAPVSNQFKPDQTSGETTAPALSPAAADSPTPPFKVQSSAFEVQGSLVEAGPTSSRTLSTPAPSSPIKPDQASSEITAPVLLPAAADSPTPPFKVQSSAFEVQGSPSEIPSPPSPALPAAHPHTSAPQEYCLMCGEPLPALLPNGKRPNPYCKCGSPIPGAPGTSLLERCPDCGELQRAHGYNAIRQYNRCHKCWRQLPALNRKNRPPWLPPTRPAASLPR